MKRYYFTLGSDKGSSWDERQQRSIECDTWSEFVTFCNQIARSFVTTVRGSETVGYNNQGHYFNG